MNSLNSTSAATVIPIFALRQHAQSKAQTKKTLAAFGAMLMLLIAMMVGGSMQSAFAQAAPAGAPIGNQASATYIDTANPSVTLNTASNTVTTIVAQVYSLTLAPPGAATKPANQQVCYPHTLTNTGNGSINNPGADAIQLNTPTTAGFTHTSIAYYADANLDGTPDSPTPITTAPTLAAGASFSFVVCGTTPPGQAVTTTGSIIISASTAAGAGPVFTTPTVTDITTIGNCSITLTKQLSSTPPAGTVVPGGLSPNTGPGGNGLYVILSYTNSGASGCTNLAITDALPAGFRYRAGTGLWSNSATPLTDAAAGDPMGIDYTGTADLMSGTITATIASVPTGTSGNVYFRVNIGPNQAVGVTAATTNTATATYTDPVAGLMGIVATSNPSTYSVAQTAGVVINGANNLSGTTSNEPIIVASAAPGQTIQWTDYVWNTGNAADNFDIRFIDGAGNPVVSGSSFNGANCALTNVAPACNFPPNTTFTVFRSDGLTSLFDNSGNSIGDTGTIPLPVGGTCPSPFLGNGTPGSHTACGYAIVVKATIPPGAAPTTMTLPNTGPYTITLQARSTFDGAVIETVPNQLTAIVANTVDLTNNAAAPTTAGNGQGVDDNAVKTTITVTPSVSAFTTSPPFRLHVNNTGLVPLVFDLSSAYVAVPTIVPALANPPVSWTVRFRLDGGLGDCSTVGALTTDTGVTPVPAGGNRLICAEVVIPPTNQGGGVLVRPTDSPPGNYDIRFRAQQSGNAAVFDTKVDRITLLAARAVAITPNGMQQTSPGGTVLYQHVITNSGNVPETITFPGPFLVDSGAMAWTSTGSIDGGNAQGVLPTPAPNGVSDISDPSLGAGNFVLEPNTSRTIFVRVNAPVAFSNTPNITTVTATYTNGTSLTVQATDTTTMTAGLRLDKYHQLTACGTAVTAPTFLANIAQAPWINTTIAAGTGTAPGQCIAYLIVAVNTTATNINNINISDPTPTNTKYQTSACTPSPMTTGPITSPTFLNDFVGNITAASSPPTLPLLPGGRATLQFCVKIN